MLKQILKAAKAPQEYVAAVDRQLCNECTEDAPRVQTTKVRAPKPYEFSHTVGVEVLGLHDLDGNCHLQLNIIDTGTNF